MMMVFILLGRYKKTTMGNNHPPLAVLGVGMSVRFGVRRGSSACRLPAASCVAEGGGCVLGCPFWKGQLSHSLRHSFRGRRLPSRLPAGSISPQESWEETHIWPITMGAARGNLKIRNVLNAWGAGKNRLVLVEELTGVLIGFSYL